MTSRKLPYRRGTGAVLFNRRGEVFVGQRVDSRGEYWQMPQGGIDGAEEPAEAVLRELEEEIGTAKAEILAESREWLTYDLPADLVGTAWGGRYRGQTQKWFALRFTGEDTDINLDTEHPEFKVWRWAPFNRIESLVVPFKRRLYRAVVQEFALIAQQFAL
jgi:putative (di)nucleoside polyphosphate hydrolase